MLRLWYCANGIQFSDLYNQLAKLGLGDQKGPLWAHAGLRLGSVEVLCYGRGQQENQSIHPPIVQRWMEFAGWTPLLFWVKGWMQNVKLFRPPPPPPALKKKKKKKKKYIYIYIFIFIYMCIYFIHQTRYDPIHLIRYDIRMHMERTCHWYLQHQRKYPKLWQRVRWRNWRKSWGPSGTS